MDATAATDATDVTAAAFVTVELLDLDEKKPPELGREKEDDELGREKEDDELGRENEDDLETEEELPRANKSALSINKPQIKIGRKRFTGTPLKMLYNMNFRDY